MGNTGILAMLQIGLTNILYSQIAVSISIRGHKGTAALLADQKPGVPVVCLVAARVWPAPFRKLPLYPRHVPLEIRAGYTSSCRNCSPSGTARLPLYTKVSRRWFISVPV